jgi:hypothetical protein
MRFALLFSSRGAPPAPDLQFGAEQYEAGRTPDYLCEPVPAQLAMNGRASTASGLAVPASMTSSPATSPASDISPGSDIELTITGDKVEWKWKKR